MNDAYKLTCKIYYMPVCLFHRLGILNLRPLMHMQLSDPKEAQWGLLKGRRYMLAGSGYPPNTTLNNRIERTEISDKEQPHNQNQCDIYIHIIIKMFTFCVSILQAYICI